MCDDKQSYCQGGCVAMHHDDAPIFLPPREHKAKISIWTDIGVSDMDILDSLDSSALIRHHLVTVFRLDDYKENSHSAALLEMFYHAVQFARENCFSKPQTAAFLSILRQVHDCCVETPFDNMATCHCFLRQLILCHSIQRPPFSINLYSLDDADKIIEYITNTYFRHYKLYKYVFTPEVSLDLSLDYPNIPLPQESTTGTSKESKQEEVEKAPENPSDKEETELVATGQESNECSTLRRLIRLHLTEELNRLKNCADMEIRAATKEIDAKLEAAEKLSESPDPENEKSGKKKDKKDKGGKKQK